MDIQIIRAYFKKKNFNHWRTNDVKGDQKLLASEAARGVALCDSAKEVEDVGEAAEEDHSSDGVRLVSSLLVCLDAVLVKDVSCDLTAFARDARDIGREAVHVECLSVLGELHHLRSALPVDELLALLEGLLVECLEGVLAGSTCTEELDALLHVGN